MAKKRLLILTQKVDLNDAVLGFFHNWLKEFSAHFETITVICLYEGKFDLPDNVKVLSLGKETGASRLKYLVNFYKHVWNVRKDYDAVFVHMNDEYAVLGGLVWKILGKKVYLWRNHIKASLIARLAVFFSTAVFCTSPFAFIARYCKNQLMPAGIDAGIFCRQPAITREKNSIFYLGRISPVKNIGIMIDAFEILKRDGVDFHGYIIGDPPERDKACLAELKQSVQDKGLAEIVDFLPSVPNYQAPEVCNRYEISANMTNSGSFDKTVLESMACENLQLISNRSFEGKIDADFIFSESDASDMAEKAKLLLAQTQTWKDEAGRKLRLFAADNHSLAALAEKLAGIINKN